jgi:hypothetical protein
MKNFVSGIVFLLISIAIFARQCADQYSDEAFLDAPERLGEIIDEGLKGLLLFGKADNYKKLGFEKIKIDGKIYYINLKMIKRDKDYIYPVKSGLWKYHTDKNGYIDEFDIADAFAYKDKVESVANEINSDFEGMWSKWGGDDYGLLMQPEDAQLRYNRYYLSLNVYLYGVEEDATGLKNTVVDYHFLNYTNEVNQYLKCKGKQ